MTDQTQHRPITAYAGRGTQREVYIDRDYGSGGGVRIHINRRSGSPTDSIVIPPSEVPELLRRIHGIADLLGITESESRS